LCTCGSDLPPSSGGVYVLGIHLPAEYPFRSVRPRRTAASHDHATPATIACSIVFVRSARLSFRDAQPVRRRRAVPVDLSRRRASPVPVASSLARFSLAHSLASIEYRLPHQDLPSQYRRAERDGVPGRHQPGLEPNVRAPECARHLSAAAGARGQPRGGRCRPSDE
jgi:hypothetical protein